MNFFLSVTNSIFLGIANYLYSSWPNFLVERFGDTLFWIKDHSSYLYYGSLTFLYYSFLGWKQQKAIDQIKNGLNPLKGNDPKKPYPKIIRIKKINLFKMKVLVEAPSHGLDDFKSNKERLESSFNQMIEKIERTNKPRFYEIFLTTKHLPKRIKFEDVKDTTHKPCEFILGESQSGIITQDLRSLPHMLIAGATGLGKSNFFKQTLMSLLRNTNHLQMHLLDLKGGLEMNEFKGLPNVNIVTTMSGALATLEKIKEEMDARFRYLANQGHNNLIPKRDRKDRIIIAVDEASVLYMKRYAQNDEGKIVQRARQVTDEIAKLARAAGIHLILATQKVTKATIDTHIRENLSGRISFKANDMEASRTVLGNGMAKDLPDIPGRGIFHLGSKFIGL